MVFVLENRHKEHIYFLKSLQDEVAAEFCQLSVQFLQGDAYNKSFQKAARKLRTEETAVKQCVEALMYLYIEAARKNISNTELKDTLIPFGLSEKQQEDIIWHFQVNRDKLGSALFNNSKEVNSYLDFAWRLDVLLASRFLRQQLKPVIRMRLTLNSPLGLKESNLTESDPGTLMNVAQELEGALREAKSHHIKRIQRMLKNDNKVKC